MKIGKVVNPQIGYPDYMFYCPGCKCSHGIWVKKEGYDGPVWNFNLDLEKPTISPSILVRFTENNKMNICHSFIKNGQIEYLNDCTHKLAGKTIEMEEY